MGKSSNYSSGPTFAEYAVVLGVITVAVIGVFIALNGGLPWHHKSHKDASCGVVQKGYRTDAQNLPVKLTVTTSWVYRTAPGTVGSTYAVVNPGSYIITQLYPNSGYFRLNGGGSGYMVYEIGHAGCVYSSNFGHNLPYQFNILRPGQPVTKSFRKYKVVGVSQ